MSLSLAQNRKGILLMLLSSLFVCFGQLLWKLSATQGLPVLLGGFVLYGIGAIVMIVAYRFGSLSVLQPMLSVNYILSTLLAVTILQEQITLFKGIGIALIMAGVLCIGGSEKR